MSDKKIKIKISELRKLIREAIEGGAPVAPTTAIVSDEDGGDPLHNEKGKEQLTDADTVVEFRSFDEDFALKITDKKYQDMAKQIFDAWSERGVDVDWAGVVNLFARNHSKNLGQEVDKTKLYEKVLDLVEKSC